MWQFFHAIYFFQIFITFVTINVNVFIIVRLYISNMFSRYIYTI